MKWNYWIGRLLGIDIYMHATFPLLVLFVIVSATTQGASMGMAALNVLAVLGLFGIVVLHELGHAMAARYYGIPTKDIILLPIGGVARITRMPTNPWQELVIAIAGPAVNVVLALLGLLMLAVVTLLQVPQLSMVVLGFTGINVLLATFNLLPAFPMDGGRVLRALLALRINYVRATNTAAMIGKGMAVFFALVAFWFNPFLLLIAAFVWIGASQEAAMVRARAALTGVPVRELMVRRFYTLAPHDRIGYAMRLLLGSFQEDFPIVEEGHLVGILRRESVREAMNEGDEWARVDACMTADVNTVTPEDALDDVMMRMQEWTQSSVPVIEHGYLVGLLTQGSVQQYIALRNARLARGPQGPTGRPGNQPDWDAPRNILPPR